MKKYIFRIAARTTGQLCISAAFLFLISLYLFFPSFTSYLNMQREKNKSSEITVTATKTVDLDEILKIKGIKMLSPIIEIDGKIALDKYELDTQIDGIMGEYLCEWKIVGSNIPDSSNMPYLVLNEAAIEAFRDVDGIRAADIDINSSLNLTFDTGNSVTAIICGILFDGEETPKVFMDYDIAKNIVGINGHYSIRIRLDKAKYYTKVAHSIKAYNLEINNTAEQFELWKESARSISHQCVISIAFLVSAVLLTSKNFRLWESNHCEEIKNLRLSGVSLKGLRDIFLLKLAVMLSCCHIGACFLAWWTSTISNFAVIITSLIAWLCFFLLRFLEK